MIKDERRRLTTEVGETLDTKFDTRGLHSDEGMISKRVLELEN